MNRYAIGIGLFLILVVVGLFLIFRGGSNRAPAPKELHEYAFDGSSEVSLTARGKINGDDIHRRIVITVARDFRQIDIIQGYEGNVIQTQRFENNSDAYQEFLYAIQRAGFVRKKSGIEGELANPLGRCPTGKLYTFQHEADSEELSNLWSASCDEMGTFAGNSSLLQTLFKAQITNYSKITSGVSL